MFPLAILLVFVGAAAAPLVLAWQSGSTHAEASYSRAPEPLILHPMGPQPPGLYRDHAGRPCVMIEGAPRVRLSDELPAYRGFARDTVRHSLRVYTVPTCAEQARMPVEHLEPRPPRPRASSGNGRR